ncbi:MAG: hypothetical protein V1743_08295 [Nanoarchaeota archaeon]
MTIIGFDFTRMLVERKKGMKGKMNIVSNVTIKDITEVDIALGPDKKALKFSFLSTTKYEPEVGDISIEGDLLYMADEKEAKHVLSSWKKDKKMPEELKRPIMNYVLSKCTIQAIFLSKEMNLPAPVPMPKVEDAGK